MREAVAYLTNEHPFYLKMMLHSAKMVREKNAEIPIHLFVVRHGLHQTIARENIQLPTQTLVVPSLQEICDTNGYILHEEEPVAGDFFHANRSLLSKVDCESLLYLDADTFILAILAQFFLDIVRVILRLVKPNGLRVAAGNRVIFRWSRSAVASCCLTMDFIKSGVISYLV